MSSWVIFKLVYSVFMSFTYPVRKTLNCTFNSTKKKYDITKKKKKKKKKNQSNDSR